MIFSRKIKSYLIKGVPEQKFYDCLRRVTVRAESYKGVFSREIVAEALLQISRDKYQEPITLPPFLIDDFKNKDPATLVKIYLDFKKHEVNSKG